MQREVHPFSATPSEVADFLLHLFQEKKCQVSTIKGYRSTISNTLKFKSDNNIGSDHVISELIKSFELQRPVERSLAPKWDLSCVLSSLCSEPYEPLHKASRFHLTLKTVFLLALATARRVSEIHAFSMDSGHLRFNQSDGSVSLRTQTGFLAKNQLPSVCLDDILVQNLARTIKFNDFNRLLCPVRALKRYLKVTEPIRKNRKRLFLPLKGDHDITKGSISRWISYTIRLASVAQLDAPSDWRPGGRGFNPRQARQHSFVEIDHEIFSTVILSLPLIQEGQLSVSGERMCTMLVNRLED